jgi:membrane-bound serine protease (ClpP class)
MHATFAFFGGVCASIGALLLLAALLDISYGGLSIQAEIALALIAIALAILAAWIFYIGLSAKAVKVKTGKEALIGSKGIAVTDLKPKGVIRVRGEFWQATAQDRGIANGEKVEVVGMDGMFLVVKPIDDKV